MVVGKKDLAFVDDALLRSQQAVATDADVVGVDPLRNRMFVHPVVSREDRPHVILPQQRRQGPEGLAGMLVLARSLAGGLPVGAGRERGMVKLDERDRTASLSGGQLAFQPDVLFGFGHVVGDVRGLRAIDQVVCIGVGTVVAAIGRIEREERHRPEVDAMVAANVPRVGSPVVGMFEVGEKFSRSQQRCRPRVAAEIGEEVCGGRPATHLLIPKGRHDRDP